MLDDDVAEAECYVPLNIALAHPEAILVAMIPVVLLVALGGLIYIIAGNQPGTEADRAGRRERDWYR